MSFLGTGFAAETGPHIQGKGLILRPFSVSDYSEWVKLRTVSREHLVPWEPAWAKNELTLASFRRRVRHYKREAREDLGYAFTIVEALSHEMLGGVTLSNLRRGVSQSASLGYWTGSPHVRKGVMSRAVSILLPYVFKELCLHRLEAASMPSNSASIKVLEKNGFVREGFARRLLKINGVWEDHLLFGLIADDVELSETKT